VLEDELGGTLRDRFEEGVGELEAELRGARIILWESGRHEGS